MKNPFSKNSNDTDLEPGSAEEAGAAAPKKKSALSPSMKKTLIAVGAAGVLAISGVLMLVSYVQSAEETAAVVDETPTESVVVVAQPVSSGTTLEALRAANFSSFRMQEVPIDLIPAGAVRSIEELDLLGDVMVDVNVSAGETLLATRFVSTEAFSTRSIVVEVPAGHHQVSFRIAPDRVLGGLIRAGDDVSIAASFSSSNGFPNLSAVVLTSVEVINVQVEGAVAPVVADENTTEPVVANRDTLNEAPTTEFLVTVAVTAEELAKLNYAIDYGRILIAAATSDPSRDISAVQTLQSIVEDAGGDLDRDTGKFTINEFERDESEDDPEQLAFTEDNPPVENSDGEPAQAPAEGVNSLQSPSEAFGGNTSGEG